jgi:hypothetical protein
LLNYAAFHAEISSWLPDQKLLLVGAIETRSLPTSLAAARRGFTFYLADPSARLTSIVRGRFK